MQNQICSDTTKFETFRTKDLETITKHTDLISVQGEIEIENEISNEIHSNDILYTDTFKTTNLETIHNNTNLDIIQGEIEKATDNVTSTDATNLNNTRTSEIVSKGLVLQKTEKSNKNVVETLSEKKKDSKEKISFCTQNSCFSYQSFFESLEPEEPELSIPSTLPEDINSNEQNEKDFSIYDKSGNYLPSTHSLRSLNFDLNIDNSDSDNTIIANEEQAKRNCKRKLDSQDDKISIAFHDTKKWKKNRDYDENTNHMIENVQNNVLTNDKIGESLIMESSIETNKYNDTKDLKKLDELNVIINLEESISFNKTNLEDKSVTNNSSLEMEKNISKPRKDQLNLRKKPNKTNNSFQQLNEVISSNTVLKKKNSVEEKDYEKVQNPSQILKLKDSKDDIISTTINETSTTKIDSNINSHTTSETISKKVYLNCSESESSEVLIESSQTNIEKTIQTRSMKLEHNFKLFSSDEDLIFPSTSTFRKDKNKHYSSINKLPSKQESEDEWSGPNYDVQLVNSRTKKSKLKQSSEEHFLYANKEKGKQIKNKELDTKIAKIDSERNNGNKRFPKKKSQKTNF